jgi:hypothetical protein
MTLYRVFFFIALVYSSTQSLQPAVSKFSLEELEEKIISEPKLVVKSKVFIDNSKLLEVPPKTILNELRLMNDYPFILLWYSYGSNKALAYRAMGCGFFNDIFTVGESIFRAMKGNYEKYMTEMLLKEFLSFSITKVDKENLLFDAVALYYGKFRSIWRKLVKPGSEKFDGLEGTFSFYRKAIDIGIYGSLELVYKKIQTVCSSDAELRLAYKKLFQRIAKLLSSNENECWGLRWLAGQEDQNFIIFYFYYLKYSPQLYYTYFVYKQRDKSLEFEFDTAMDVLKKSMNLNFELKNRQLIFAPDFKNPFPPEIMGTEELKSVISTIVSKLLLFCF